MRCVDCGTDRKGLEICCEAFARHQGTLHPMDVGIPVLEDGSEMPESWQRAWLDGQDAGLKVYQAEMDGARSVGPAAPERDENMEWVVMYPGGGVDFCEADSVAGAFDAGLAMAVSDGYEADDPNAQVVAVQAAAGVTLAATPGGGYPSVGVHRGGWLGRDGRPIVG